MAGTKTSSLVALTTVADGDLLPIVDISDTTQAPTGSTKKTTAADFIASRTMSGIAGRELVDVDPTDPRLPDPVDAYYAPPSLMQGRMLVGQGNSPYWLATNTARTILYCLLTLDSVVKAYDLTDESNPVLLGTSPALGPGPAYLAVFGTTLYVTDQNNLTLRVINASNPAAMTVTSTFTYDSSGGTGGGRFAINTAGTQLLIGGPEGGSNANKAVLVDVSGAPAVLGRTPAIGAIHRGVAYMGSNKWALASRDDGTVRIVDSSTPSAPVQSSQFSTVSGTVTTPLKADGSILYVGNYGTGFLEKWDLTTIGSPVLLGTATIGAGAEQIDLTTDSSYAFVGLRASNSLARVNTADMSAEVFALPGTVTPGVAVADDHVYVTAAGDSTNGKIIIFAVTATATDAFDSVNARVGSLDTATAKLAGNQTFTGTQTISAATALDLTNAAAKIKFSTDVELYRNATASLRADVALRLLELLLYPSSATALRVFGAVNDSQPKLRLDTDSIWLGPGGSTAPDVRLNRGSANVLSLLTSEFRIATAGRGLRVTEGSNCKQGTATLVAGTVTVSNTVVTASSRIFLTAQSLGTVTAPKAIAVTARTAGTSFTITSADNTDTSVIAYEIFEPA